MLDAGTANAHGTSKANSGIGWPSVVRVWELNKSVVHLLLDEWCIVHCAALELLRWFELLLTEWAANRTF